MAHKPISDHDLQRMRRLCLQATSEPLAVIGQKRGRVVLCQANTTAEDVVIVAKYYDPNALANASLAAAANGDMRRLLNEIKRLRTILVEHGIPYDS
jgi:hypothetical protein